MKLRLWGTTGRRLLILLGMILLCGLPDPGRAAQDPMLNQGVVLINQGRYAEALEFLRQARSRALDRQSLDPLLGHAFLGLGYQNLESGDYRAALDAFSEAATYRPDDVGVWQGQALAYLHQGQNSAAEAAVQEALGINAEEPRLYLLLGRARYAAGDMGGAVSALRLAEERGGDEAVQAFLVKVEQEWLLEQGMRRDFSSIFLLSYADEGQSELAEAILDTLEGAYTELGAELDYYPEIKVPVLLYTRRDFQQVTRSPDWAGALYDGKIRIPLGGLREMSVELEALLYHEYAHALMRYLGRGRVPVWLNEGYAELAGRRHFNPALDVLEQALAGQGLLPWERLEQDFAGLAAAQVPLAYEQSYSLCRFLVTQHGWHLFRDLIEGLAGGMSLEQAFAEAYGDYGITWSGIQRTWRDEL